MAKVDSKYMIAVFKRMKRLDRLKRIMPVKDFNEYVMDYQDDTLIIWECYKKAKRQEQKEWKEFLNKQKIKK